MVWLLVLFVSTGLAQIHDALKTISQIKDNESIDITDENCAMLESQTPWILYIYHPNERRCRLFGPQWKFFAEKVRREKVQLSVGKVDISGSPNLVKNLKISSIPTFIYIDEGYAYNYTGRTESKELLQLIGNKTYLQYDRREFVLHQSYFQEIYSKVLYYFRFSTDKYPIITAIVGFVSLYGVLKLFERKRKKEKEE